MRNITDNGKELVLAPPMISIDDDTYIDYDNRLYKVKMVEFMDDPLEYNDNYLYIEGDYFLPYKGTLSQEPTESALGDLDVGIYRVDIDTKLVKGTTIIHRVPVTNEEKSKYYYKDKISSHTGTMIRDKINTGDVSLVSINDKTALVIAIDNTSPDVLKRAIVEAQNRKNIDIDAYINRFPTKNAASNYKQAINSPNEISAKIFKRAIEAFGLKFTIIIEDNVACGDSIGLPLSEPIVVSSEDTFKID